MRQIQGIGASRGISIGRLFRIQTRYASVPKKYSSDPDVQMKRFFEAQKQVLAVLENLYQTATKKLGESESVIFQIHQLILQDAYFLTAVRDFIHENGHTAEYAIKQTSEQYEQIFREMDDPYMRERAADIVDISRRMINTLSGTQSSNLGTINHECILACTDLLPSETITLNKQYVLAFLTKQGSNASHSAIIARTMGIPAIAGLGAQLDTIQEGQMLIVDGFTGTLIVDPDEAAIAIYQKKKESFLHYKTEIKQLKGTPNITADGMKIQISSNIGHVWDCENANENGTEGIGLFRSEFLYLDSKEFPNEEQHLRVYQTVLEKMEGQRVVIRTFDLGTDKPVPYLSIDQEANPAMGYRAIRISLDRPDMFRTQLRALHRASVYGKLAILFPMIVSLHEIRQVKEIVRQVKAELDQEKIAYAKDIEYGIMIETPAAAVLSDLLAKEVDFFSIGTNDLTQHTLAADRTNNKVSGLYDTRNPAVLRLIQMTVNAAHANGLSCCVCGESASDPNFVPIYLSLGIDQLSVSPEFILDIRHKVQTTDVSAVRDDILWTFFRSDPPTQPCGWDNR